MTEEHCPWQRRYDYARLLLARALLKSPAPWSNAAVREHVITECLVRSGLKGTPVERYFRLQALCLLLGMEPFPGRRVLIA